MYLNNCYRLLYHRVMIFENVHILDKIQAAVHILLTAIL